MSESFDFNEWIRNNKTGPYSKDSFARKGMLKESEESIEEDDTMEEAPKPPSPENIYEPEQSGGDYDDYYDRAWGLAGTQIKQVIDDLRNDGYEDEDIKDIFRTAVEMYDQAFSGMDESEEEDPNRRGLQRMRSRSGGEIAWEDQNLDKYVAKVLSDKGFTTKDGTKVELRSPDQLVKWVMSILNRKLPNASQETKQWIEKETRKKYNDPAWNKNV